MSTAPRGAAAALFAGLIDDAAVFPPAELPTGEALRHRRDRIGTLDARYIGSFLVPPAQVERVLQEVHPVPVVVIGRPGTDLAEVINAAEQVADDPIHALAGVQVGLADGWEAVTALGVPVAVEVPADRTKDSLDVLLPRRPQVLAKLRTGATAAAGVPTPAQLAAFISGCHRRHLSFRLTGGLHRAVTHSRGPACQFGFLNVIAATDAVVRGSDPTALLEERDADAIAAAVRGIDDRRAHAVRDLFQSYGCCDPQDPLRDLRSLGLIEEKL